MIRNSRKKRSLVGIVSFSTLFIFFIYFSFHSFNIPLLLFNPTNTATNIHNDFSFTIKVLTYNRLPSLSRCLNSLANSDYANDHGKVHLHIFVDHFLHSQNYYPDQKLNQSHTIMEFLDGFQWRFGLKTVHYRTQNVGLQAQWLEAWWPSSDHDFAFIVEDDLELSPLYYKFLKGLIQKYYYDPSNFHPSVYGASLQRPRFVPGDFVLSYWWHGKKNKDFLLLSYSLRTSHFINYNPTDYWKWNDWQPGVEGFIRMHQFYMQSKHGNKMQLDRETRIFLYQLVGTWGQLLFPRPWKEFRLWYDIHKAKGLKPILEGMVTTRWYRKLGEKIWSPWFIKFCHSSGYFNLYSNFLDQRALVTSHRDVGVNYGKSAGPDSILLDENSLDFDLMEMQPLSKLKWYDFCFRQVIPDKIVRSWNELSPVIHSRQKQKTVILINLLRVSNAVTRNLLCHFESQNIQNYILVGPKSDFLLDLARRGHPVICMDQLLDDMQAHKLVNVQEHSRELIKEMIVMGYSIKNALELGYNIWVIDGNFLPVSGRLFDSSDSISDFYIGNTFSIFFARSSSSTQKNWLRYLNKAISVKALEYKDSTLSNERHFVHMMAAVLGQERIGIKSLDETALAVEIGNISMDRSSLTGDKELVLWSSEMGVDLIRERLGELGMWMIDSDLSCTAVVCHES